MSSIVDARGLGSARYRAVATAVAALRRGELVAMPTETVYGLAADAYNARAVGKIALPVAGEFLSAGVAAAGTWGIGEAAIAYFIENRTIEEAKERFRRKKKEKEEEREEEGEV